jgi:hypothetical protein
MVHPFPGRGRDQVECPMSSGEHFVIALGRPPATVFASGALAFRSARGTQYESGVRDDVCARPNRHAQIDMRNGYKIR